MAIRSGIYSNVPSFPSSYYQSNGNISASGQTDVVVPAMDLDIGGSSYRLGDAATLPINSDSSWDFGQDIGTWTANHSYSEGDWVRPNPSSSVWDGANNSRDYNSLFSNPKVGSDLSSGGLVYVTSRANSSYAGYKAFDKTLDATSSAWCSLAAPSEQSPQSIMFDFLSIVVVNKYYIYGNSRHPMTWILQGSNNAAAAVNDEKNSNGWVDLDTKTNEQLTSNVGYYYTFTNNTGYQKYRLRVTLADAADFMNIPEMSLILAPVMIYKCTSSGTSLSSEPTWGTTAGGTTAESGGPTWTCYYDDASASNRAGVDYCVYACQQDGLTPKLLLSRNSTYPSGYTASNSRKIGGFHTLCGSVGTISGHSLTGYLTGSVLPYSVWDLKHRSASGSNIGQVYIPEINKWVAIYLTSGTSAAPTIVFGGTILDTITYFVSYAACRVLKGQLPKDSEFAVFAAGSNEATNILGSADPVTVTAAVDTAGRRMISNYGVESAAGSMWQWLCDTSYRFDGATAHTHSVTVSGDPQTVTSGNASADVAPAWTWKAQTGGKGSLYTQGPVDKYGTTKLIAGGRWNGGSECGSQSRDMSVWPWWAGTNIGFRFCCESKEL